MENSSSSNTTKVILPLIIILIVVALVIFLLTQNKSNAVVNNSTNSTLNSSEQEMLNTTTNNPVSEPVSDTLPTLEQGISDISINNMTFINGNITVAKGSTVVWTNNDSVSHSIIADEGAFASQILTKGNSFTYTFNDVGVFTYHCGIHSEMTGTIVVK